MDAGRALRDVLALLPAGVVIVSGGAQGAFRGMAATSFTAVSLEPPLVLACLDSLSATTEAVLAGRAFNASLLAREQEFLADRFSGRAPSAGPAWREVPHRLGGNGLPLVEGAVAWFECALEQAYEAGDHTIAVGRVTGAGHGAGEPLVFWDRAFWRLR